MSAERPFFFTWSAQRNARGREVVGGDGAWFTTADGGRWLDLGSLSFQASLGHGHPRMVAAIERQARELSLAAAWTLYPKKREAAERLLALAPPGFGVVFFTLGGSESVENALKIARLFTGKPRFAARYQSYHGSTLGALSVSGDYRRPPLEPLLAVARLPWRDPDGAAEVLREEGGRVAAVILEFIAGANGVTEAPRAYYQAVRQACDEEGALLIADEVFTGFGRTGRAFGFEHSGVVPDLITVAKGLTAGYAPLGAVLVSYRVARHFDDEVLWAGMTNYAHPLGCATAAEAMAIYQEEALFERAAGLEGALLAPLADLARAQPEVVTNPRARGLLGAVDLRLSPAGWKRLAAGLEARRLHVPLSERRGNAILAPPLVIGDQELKNGLAGFTAAVKESAT